MSKSNWQGLLIGVLIGGIGFALLLALGVRFEAAFFAIMVFAFALALWNPKFGSTDTETDDRANHPANNSE